MEILINFVMIFFTITFSLAAVGIYLYLIIAAAFGLSEWLFPYWKSRGYAEFFVFAFVFVLGVVAPVSLVIAVLGDKA